MVKQCDVDLVAVARIAGRPASFVLVEVGQETETAPHAALPCRQLHWSGEGADGVGGEVSLGGGTSTS